ncbi:NYN domain-containing protein [Candidatus Woesearchaeota archaeon]|nr:NYN domain-containing protein [Candidatus Woesearchaeota archaeon]
MQNLYYSAKNLYHAKVNFKAVLKEAEAGRTLIRALAYVIKADIKEEKNFFDALRNIGYEIKMKDLQIFYGGAKKGDWDIGIAMDMIELAHKLDVVVLVSGDGDFIPLVEHMKRAMGCRVEVLAFGKTTSSKLIDTADEFVDLDMVRRKFLIPMRQREEMPREESHLAEAAEALERTESE